MATANPPAKPYHGFPLFAHQNGQYAKKTRGRLRYFGRVSDGWEAALKVYQLQRDDGQSVGTTRAEDGQTQNYTAYYPKSLVPIPLARATKRRQRRADKRTKIART